MTTLYERSFTDAIRILAQQIIAKAQDEVPEPTEDVGCRQVDVDAFVNDYIAKYTGIACEQIAAKIKELMKTG